MSILRRSTSRTAPTAPTGARRTRRAIARALASAPTQESRHELVALATRL